MDAAGLPFAQMSLAQQQQFIVGTQTSRVDSPEALASAVLRVEYTQPGWFEWVAQEPSSRGPGPIKLPPVRERTWAAALQAARRIDPQVDPAKVVPTELAVRVLYTLGNAETGGMTREVGATPTQILSWGYSFPAERDSRRSRNKP
jgi:hypothetical protein